MQFIIKDLQHSHAHVVEIINSVGIIQEISIHADNENESIVSLSAVFIKHSIPYVSVLGVHLQKAYCTRCNISRLGVSHTQI